MFRSDQITSLVLAAVGALFLSSVSLTAAIAPGHQVKGPESFALASAEVVANG